MATPTTLIDEIQLEYIVAAILAAGVAAGIDNGTSPETAVKLYRRALKTLREGGLDASMD